MDLLEAAMKADNLQLDADDLEGPDPKAIVIEENLVMVTDKSGVCESEIEVTTPLVHFDQGVSDLCGSEIMEQGQTISDVGNEEIIPAASGNGDLNECIIKENFPIETVNEEKTDSGETIMIDEISKVTKKPTYKRKGPNKKSLRKRFNRPKRYAERQKRLKALKALSANPGANELDLSVVSQSEQTGRLQDKIFQSVPSGSQQPLMTIIKEESLPSVVNSISTSQPKVSNFQTCTKKIIFKRDIHRPGLIIGTPVDMQDRTPNTVCSSQMQLSSSKPLGVQNPKIHPIHKLKSVFMKCFKKPVSSSVSNLQHPIAKIHAANPIFQQSISEEIISTPDLHSVSVKPCVDNADFIDESTSFEDTTEQILPHQDEQRGNFSGSIPTTSIVHITQPGTISMEPTLAHSRNAVIITPMNQSQYIPTSIQSFSMNGISSSRMLDSVEVQQQANVESVEQLLESVGKTLVEVIPPPWITVLKHNGIAVCLLSHSNIITIQRSLLVEANGNVTVGVHGKELPASNPFWQHVKPVVLRPDTVKQFIANIEKLLVRLRGMEVCKAVEDFEPFWKTATNCEVDLNRFHELRFRKCCRAESCHLLVTGLHYKRCIECTKVCRLLSRRASVDSKKPDKALSLRKPFKYLSSPEKRERFDLAVREIRRLRRANKRFKEKLEAATSEAAEDSQAAPEDSPENSLIPDGTGRVDDFDSDFEWPEDDPPF